MGASARGGSLLHCLASLKGLLRQRILPQCTARSLARPPLAPRQASAHEGCARPCEWGHAMLCVLVLVYNRLVPPRSCWAAAAPVRARERSRPPSTWCPGSSHTAHFRPCPGFGGHRVHTAAALRPRSLMLVIVNTRLHPQAVDSGARPHGSGSPRSWRSFAWWASGLRMRANPDVSPGHELSCQMIGAKARAPRHTGEVHLDALQIGAGGADDFHKVARLQTQASRVEQTTTCSNMACFLCRRAWLHF